MKRRGVQLTPRHKRWFYSVSLTLFLSGAAWVLFNWSVARAEGHADFFLSLKTWSLKLHGAAAMAFLIALGILIPTHMRRAWRTRRNQKNGGVFATVLALLILTGYGLYYLGSEEWRSSASWIHLILGFASPALLVWHIWQGRRATRL